MFTIREFPLIACLLVSACYSLLVGGQFAFSRPTMPPSKSRAILITVLQGGYGLHSSFSINIRSTFIKS